MRSKRKILFIAADPFPGTQLAIAVEQRAILKQLRGGDYRDAFDLVFAPAARPSDLQQALLEHQPLVVHFSGHGSKSHEIILHDESGTGTHPISADALEELFGVLRDNIRLVVLNACYTQAQAVAIAKNIEFVVGMNDAIGDQAAVEFSAAFYGALGFGRTVAEGLGLGKNALKLLNLAADAEIPTLHHRVDANPKTACLVELQATSNP